MENEGPIILEQEIPVFMRCVRSDEEAISNYKKYGPANPLVNNGREDHEFEFCQYSYDGVCYMLTCNCRRDDIDVENGEWYNGKCNYNNSEGQYCQTILNNKTDAWRTPLENGGFNGCFCKDHFRRCIPRPDDKEEFSLYHTLCDIMIMVRERYPVQEYSDYEPDVEIYGPEECM